MAIEIKCNCGLDYRLDDSRAGEVFKCRLCGAEIHMPASVGRASPNSPVSRSLAKKSGGSETIDNSASENIEAIDWSQFNNLQHSTDEKNGISEGDIYTDAAANAPIKSKPRRSAKSKIDEDTHKVPPLGWWCIRAVMWLICISFIFAPWLKLSVYNPASGKRETEHITGWNMATSVVEEMRYTGAIHPAAAAPILENYAEPESSSKDASLVAIGGRMMAIGAAVFLAGIIAVPITGVLVLIAGPRAMALPFAVCLLSLSSFTAGWFTAITAGPMRAMLDNMEAQNCHIGISASIYMMLPILAILSLRAGIRPDYKLLQALQWSRQRNENGS